MASTRVAWMGSPTDWLDWNPILRREAGRTIRRPMTHILFILPVLITSVALFFSEPATSTGPAPIVWDFSRASRDLFLLMNYLFLLVTVVFGPGMSAAAASQESRGETGDMLRLTLIRPMSIVLGHWGSAMMRLILVWLSILPAVFLMNLLGGFSPGEFLMASLVILVAGCTATALGVLVGIRGQHTNFTYLAVAMFLGSFYLAGPLLARIPMIAGGLIAINWSVVRYLSYTSPVQMLISIFSMYTPGAGLAGSGRQINYLLFYMGFSLSLTLLFLLAARFLWSVQVEIKTRRGLAKPGLKSRAKLIIGRRGEPFLDGVNLILQREMRRTLWTEWRVLVALLLFGCAVAILEIKFEIMANVVTGLIIVGSVMTFLIASFSGARAFDLEKKHGILENLTMTGISPRSLLAGKFLASSYPALLLWAPCLPMIIAMPFSTKDQDTAIGYIIYIGVTALLIPLEIFAGAILGVWASITCRSTQAALARTGIISIVWVFFTAICGCSCFPMGIIPVLATIWILYVAAMEALCNAMNVPLNERPRSPQFITDRYRKREA